MIPYREFRPTSLDIRGLGLPDRQDWFVVEIFRGRDSNARERSNFAVVLADLQSIGPDDVEDHSFGHWAAPFEIILVRPDTAAAAAAEKWECALADYPVADDSALAEAEEEEKQEAWQHMCLRDRIDLCRDAGVSIFAARRGYPPSDDSGRIDAYLLGH